MTIQKWDRVSLDGIHGEVVQDGCTQSLVQFPADPLSGCDYEREWIDNSQLTVESHKPIAQESETVTETLRKKALLKVQNSPKLAPHEATIMYGWLEDGEHWRWVLDVSEEEIVDWAQAIEAGTTTYEASA